MRAAILLAQAGAPAPGPTITPPAEPLPWTLVAALVVGIALFGVYRLSKRTPGGSAPPPADEGFFRNEIARALLYSAIGGIVVLAALIIVLSFARPTAAAQAKVVFDSLLPVFGTWVGTLLAFYFSKENFEAATKSVTEIAKAGVTGTEKLKSLRVRDAMKRADQIVTLPPNWQGKKSEEIPIGEVVSHLGAKKVDRLPLFADNKPSGRAVCVIHLSNIHRFLARKTLAGQPTDALKLAELLADAELAPVFKHSYTCVAETCTLADAKTAMDEQSKALSPLGNCYDVFVTSTGSETEPVIGWITNDIINENAKL